MEKLFLWNGVRFLRKNNEMDKSNVFLKNKFLYIKLKCERQAGDQPFRYNLNIDFKNLKLCGTGVSVFEDFVFISLLALCRKQPSPCSICESGKQHLKPKTSWYLCTCMQLHTIFLSVIGLEYRRWSSSLL